MKTLKNQIFSNKTRKGGKTAKENFNNYVNYWEGVMRKGRPMYPEYDAQMNYPGYFKKLKGEFPSMNNAATTLNTYTFSRHGYSCANLLKSQKSYQQFTDPDPSLTTYGILSILKTISPKPQHYTGKVFVSSLIRTWQTAILEYGSYPEPLTIIISPYIKEKHYENKVDIFNVLSSLDVSNIPLPLDQQIRKMKKFLEMLNSVQHEKVKSILTKDIQFIYDKKTFTLNQPYEPYTFVNKTSKLILELPLQASGTIVNTEIFVPRIKIKEPSYTEYFGGEGFVYFDHWVRQHYPDRHVFVVSHSGFMKSILKKYSDINVETDIFNQNVWKLSLTPITLEYNYKVNISPGIVKPSKEILSLLSKDSEILCHRESGTSDHPVSLLPKDSYSMNEQYADPLMTNVTQTTPLLPLLSEPSETPIQDIDQTPIAYHSKTEPYEAEESKESYPEPKIKETPEPAKIKVTELPPPSQKGKLLRSYRILFEFITNKQNLSELIALVNSKEQFKKKCIDYIRSHDIFSNHYLAFVLMYPPYLKRVIENLDSSVKQTAIYTYITYCFGASNVSVKKIRDFLIEFSKMIKTDEDLYNLMIDKIRIDSNTFYYHNFAPIYFFGTLLDLFYYEMYVYRLTDDTKEFTFKVIHDLLSKGARFSKPIPSSNMNDLVDSIELLSDEEIVEKMELLQIPLDMKYKDDLKAYFSRQLINQLSQKKKTFEKIQPYFTYADMITKEGAIDDSKLLNRYKCPILSPDVEFTVEPTMVVDPSDGNLENYFKKHILSPLQKQQLIGGSRGTSWKRSSLRRFSVKGGRYRALQYKGKRRSRVNRR
jgi:broad specificity phosphatase PhoE